MSVITTSSSGTADTVAFRTDPAAKTVSCGKRDSAARVFAAGKKSGNASRTLAVE